MSSPSAVRHRLALYLSGFDPQGPAHYHQLYSTEATKQAQASGHTLEVGRRRKASEHIAWWEVQGRTDGAPDPTTTRYEFLRWDDVVRTYWPRGRWALFQRTVFATLAMWGNGVMWRSMKTSWPMFVAIALPGAMIVLLSALLLGLGGAAAALLAADLPWLAGGLVLLGLPALAGLGMVAERRTNMAWLMRSLACLAEQGRGQTPDLEARLDHFADHLAAQLRAGTWDEVLLIGHSSGAMMAMIVAARALQRLSADGPTATAAPLSLLTLGHCSPLLSYQPEAEAFRAELRTLHQAQGSRLHWVDYGAPPDGCCFPLVDPTAPAWEHTPTALRAGAPPKLLNPRFAQHFTPATYQAVRRDKFRCHFQYLMATECPGDYDYFALTAGPLTLAQRHAERPSVTDFRQFQRLGGPGL
jgi:pimeloyl-ACP methyl ester carboxylesterase